MPRDESVLEIFVILRSSARNPRSVLIPACQVWNEDLPREADVPKDSDQANSRLAYRKQYRGSMTDVGHQGILLHADRKDGG